MKLKSTVIAMALAFPMLASAQSASQLQKEVDELKAQVKALQELMHGKTAAPAADAAPQVDLEEFNRIKTKVEAADDTSLINGMKGLRISGGIDPVYIYNDAKGTASFSFGNGLPADGYTYDDGTFGIAYLDIQKEMEGGTKFRLTLAPTKSNSVIGSGSNASSIISEASASIPLTDASTRLMVGQMPDVSGYEPAYNNYAGTNSITSNQLYPGYAEFFVTKNMLFDFTAATYYTGLGLDLISGPLEQKIWIANVNSPRNDTTVGAGANGLGQPAVNTTPGLIYYIGYYQEEYWGVESTIYWIPSAAGGFGGVRQFEIDGNYTRGDFNTNLQFTAGGQDHAAANGGDSLWYGFSAMVSEKLGTNWTIAGRADYLNNQNNGGGIWALVNTCATGCTNPGAVTGNVTNGFIQDLEGDPTGNTGTNRAALTVAATYRINPYAALRGELRRDFATTSAFYNWGSGTFQSTNNTVALQALVNF